MLGHLRAAYQLKMVTYLWMTAPAKKPKLMMMALALAQVPGLRLLRARGFRTVEREIRWMAGSRERKLRRGRETCLTVWAAGNTS